MLKAKVFYLFIVLLLLALLPQTRLAAQEYPPNIVPFLPGNSGLTWELDSAYPTNLYTGWAVCRARGLLRAYQNAFEVDMIITDATGNPVATVTPDETKQYWWPIEQRLGPDGIPLIDPECNNHPDHGYRSFWVFTVPLAPGIYQVELTAVLTHPITDMFESDGSSPAKYPADEPWEWSGTLIVS